MDFFEVFLSPAIPICILAVAFYSFMLYLILPYKTVSVKTTCIFFIFGVLSFVSLGLFYILYPEIGEPVDLPFTFFEKDLDQYLFFTFIQVSAVEELFKFTIFIIILKILVKRGSLNKNENLVAYLLYASVCYAGFSFLETFIVFREAFAQRLIFSLITHMFLGILISYWYVLSILPKKPKRSVYYLLSNKYTSLTKYLTIFFGFICTVVIHGVYNFNASQYENELTVDFTITIAILMVLFEIYFAIKMIDHIIKKEAKVKSVIMDGTIDSDN